MVSGSVSVCEGGPFNVRSCSRNLTELLSKGRIFAQYFDLTAYTPFFLAWHFSSEKIAVFPMYSVLFRIFFWFFPWKTLELRIWYEWKIWETWYIKVDKIQSVFSILWFWQKKRQFDFLYSVHAMKRKIHFDL